MHFYAIPRETLLETPIKTFWSLNRNIDRLRAEAEIRQLSLLNAAQSKEGTEKASKLLRQEIGEVTRAKSAYERGKMKALMAKIRKEDQERGATPLRSE